MGDLTNPKDLLGIKKPPLHLVPAALALWVSQVFGKSAVKYGPYNWREKSVRKSIYLDAIERHLLALKDGEARDPETGLPHEAHIGANCAILLDAKETGNLINDMPWQSGPAPTLIAKMTEKTTTPDSEPAAASAETAKPGASWGLDLHEPGQAVRVKNLSAWTR